MCGKLIVVKDATFCLNINKLLNSESIYFSLFATNSKGQILILADESLEDSIVHSDSRSLATLLLIRDIQVTVVAAIDHA